MAGLWARRREVLVVLCTLVTMGACATEGFWTPAGRRVGRVLPCTRA